MFGSVLEVSWRLLVGLGGVLMWSWGVLRWSWGVVSVFEADLSCLGGAKKASWGFMA